MRGDLTEPFVYFISYFNPVLNLTGNENYNQPLYRIIHDASGSIASKSLEKIYAINADEKLVEKLQIETNTALLKRVRMVSIKMNYQLSIILDIIDLINLLTQSILSKTQSVSDTKKLIETNLLLFEKQKTDVQNALSGNLQCHGR